MGTAVVVGPVGSPLFALCPTFCPFPSPTPFLFDHFPIRSSASDHDCDRLERLDIGTHYLQDAGNGNGKEHSGDTPDIAPKRQRHENDEGTEIQLDTLDTRVEDISEHHLYGDHEHSHVDDVRPIGEELQQRHGNGHDGDDDRADAWDKIEDK